MHETYTFNFDKMPVTSGQITKADITIEIYYSYLVSVIRVNSKVAVHDFAHESVIRTEAD